MPSPIWWTDAGTRAPAASTSVNVVSFTFATGSENDAFGTTDA